MRAVKRFQVIANEESADRCTICDGENRLRVPGFDLLKQFELCNGEHLVILDNDNPWEPETYFVLVSRENTVVESISLWALFADGLMTATPLKTEDGEDVLIVTFETSRSAWRIKVAATPKTRYRPRLGWFGSRCWFARYRMDFEKLEFPDPL